MGGIFGYVGEHAGAAQLVFEGLGRLVHRGYDQWGIAVGGAAHIVVERGAMSAARTGLPPSTIGLGHARPAAAPATSTTAASAGHDHADPQLDCAAQLAIAADGAIAHDAQLRAALARAGHRVRSHSDSELIAHLIEDLLSREPKSPHRLVRATGAAFRKLRGIDAVVAFDLRTGQIAAARSGTPLVVGLAADGHFIASDSMSLLGHVRSVAFVGQGQMVSLDRDRAQLFDIETGEELAFEWQPETVEYSSDDALLPGFVTQQSHTAPIELSDHMD